MKTSTFLVWIVLVTGFLANRDKIAHWINPPPVINPVPENTEVVLYSTTWCGYCAKTRQYFAENHIKYAEFDVEHTAQGQKDYERLGGNGVPIVVINKESIIYGYDPEEIAQSLNALTQSKLP